MSYMYMYEYACRMTIPDVVGPRPFLSFTPRTALSRKQEIRVHLYVNSGQCRVISECSYSYPCPCPSGKLIFAYVIA